MEFDTSQRSVSEKLKRQLGMITGQGTDPETGRSYAEERMIGKMQKHGGRAFRVLRSAETPLKNYERLNN